jgi:predicted RNA polymerase sigma factor
MRLHLARADARFDTEGKLILLASQDRSRWDRQMIRDAGRLIEQAAALGRPGPYQIQAALVACHAEAESWQATDWPQVLGLYDLLLSLTPSPVIRLNRAVALRYVAGPEAALAEVETLGAFRDYREGSGEAPELLRQPLRMDVRHERPGLGGLGHMRLFRK